MTFLIPEEDDRSAHGHILRNHITAETAANLSGYNLQYIRRLACDGKLEAVRVGRAWLIDLASLQDFIKRALRRDDPRSGPRRERTRQPDFTLEWLDE